MRVSDSLIQARLRAQNVVYHICGADVPFYALESLFVHLGVDEYQAACMANELNAAVSTAKCTPAAVSEALTNFIDTARSEPTTTTINTRFMSAGNEELAKIISDQVASLANINRKDSSHE